MRPSRKPKIGWKTVVSARAERTRRTSAWASARIWLTCSFTRATRVRRPVSSDAVPVEPRKHPAPSVVGGLLAIRRAVVGVERVRRVRIGVDLARLPGRLERRAHAVHAFVRDARVRTAVQAQDGRANAIDDV